MGLKRYYKLRKYRISPFPLSSFIFLCLGEHMTEYELAEHLATLLGFNAEGGTCEQEEFDAQKAGNYIADALPFDVSAEIMINEILGFSITTDPPGADDTKVVVKSGAS